MELRVRGLQFDFRLAEEDDAMNLISFLAKPAIDQSFVLPLSRRSISIEARVRQKLSKGFWLIVFHGKELIGCRGCSGVASSKECIVEFSTTAVSPDYQGKGLGTTLLLEAVKVAFNRYAPALMKFDSWVGNIAMDKASSRAGFIRHRVFEDPSKRPPGVQSVEYILECRLPLI